MKSFISRFGTKKAVALAAGIIILVWIIYAAAFRKTGPSQSQLITVTRGSIAETVDVTGNTTPVKSIDLAFQSGGTVAAVNADVGARVHPGEILVSLNTADLQAQLAQAQAQVDAAMAQLRSLQTGTRPEDVAAARANLAGAQQSLANLYANVDSALTDAFAKSNDAVRNQLSAFFSNAENPNPQLTFQVSDSQIVNNIEFARVQASAELNNWQIELAAINGTSPSSTLEVALQKGAAHIETVNHLLAVAGQVLIGETSLSPTTLSAYKTSLANALTEENSASNGLNSAMQNIASQKITIQGLQAALDKAVNGPTKEDIAAQQAQVEQAQASAQSVQAKISQNSLVSPIDGVVTVQNAKVGQFASPGTVMVSIISDSNLEVDANVPETDIGKLAVNNPVDMTFDAFPGETFTGKLFFIDPAETIIQGVVDYKIKVAFDKKDPRVKSGLTANLSVKTQEKDGVLILPQFAVLQTDQGASVKLYKNGAVTEVPVTLGIRDEKGNIEITSGVSEGDQVQNIGLK